MRSGANQLLFVFDTCYAGGGISDTAEVLNEARGEAFTIATDLHPPLSPGSVRDTRAPVRQRPVLPLSRPGAWQLPAQRFVGAALTVPSGLCVACRQRAVQAVSGSRPTSTRSPTRSA